MKIKKIQLINNSFFGNAEFVFTDANGQIMDNVIIAGENGCGKTQLLNIIYDFSKLPTTGEVTNEKRIFTVVLCPTELQLIKENLEERYQLHSPTGEMDVTVDFTAQPGYWARLKFGYQSMESDGTITRKSIDSSHLFSQSNIKSIFKSLFSTVEINYNPKDTSNVTAKEIDEEFQTSIRSGNDLASEIQQLLIDIQDNDANELLTWVNKHIGMVPPESILNRRISRFKNAFSRVFDNLNFSRIVTENGKKKVYFEKNNHDVDIALLSSGEKQIVFRGAFLLRNQQSTKGSVVLIDEPEISLHPIWQEKILNYYMNLFISSAGNQTSQIFIATHSQYVLRSALEETNNTLILLLSNSSGTIECKSITAPLVLPSITSAELNYVAFDLVSNDYHIELYGYLQNKIGTSSVKACDDYIVAQTTVYDASKHAKSSAYGATTYQTLPTYIRNAIDHPDPSRTFTQGQLRTSIELLIELCR